MTVSNILKIIKSYKTLLIPDFLLINKTITMTNYSIQEIIADLREQYELPPITYINNNK